MLCIDTGMAPNRFEFKFVHLISKEQNNHALFHSIPLYSQAHTILQTVRAVYIARVQ